MSNLETALLDALLDRYERSRGFKEKEFEQIGEWIVRALRCTSGSEAIRSLREEVLALTAQYPIRHD